MKVSTLLWSAFAGLVITRFVASAEPPASAKDQTHGSIRCVLVSVGQTTIYPNDNPDEPEHGDKSGVPCLTVTYMLESLGDKPFRATVLRSLEFSAGGKPLKLLSSQNNRYHKAVDYDFFQTFLDFTKPAVTNPKRAIFFQHVEFAAIPNLRAFDITLEAGFDDDVSKFVFKGVRLQ